MTPDDFLDRILGVVDEAAFLLAGTPCELQEAWLHGFDRRVGRQWRQTFTTYMSASDVDGMVDDVVARIRVKRDCLERFGSGSA